ncbi:MAG: hypothetical protein NT029_00990 [Armatimonadetes bacterium]|nr:hypothetical protein [Armatimonadota bacterium]
MRASVWLAACAAAAMAAPSARAGEPVVWKGKTYARTMDRTAAWEQVGGDLIRGFVNMYHLTILKEPARRDYPYRGWFFGWAAETCNRAQGHGCDMIFAARAPRLEGPWEVWCGGDRWDAGTDVARWKPCLAAGNAIYDSWHNGDPSIVKVGKRYHMAYSATGHNRDGIPFGAPGDTDSDLNCVMGATSEDGLNWTRTAATLLIEPANIGQAPVEPGSYMHPTGLFHRPSLRRERGKWRLWFDCYTGTDMPMGYAENPGEFGAPDGFRVLRGPANPVEPNFPNPDVVEVRGVLFAYGDPGGLTPLEPSDPALKAKMDRGWASRKIVELISLDGLRWVPLGFIERDADMQADQVPAAYVEGDTIYLTYGAQPFGGYSYDRIRMKRRTITASEAAEVKAMWRGVTGRDRQRPSKP